jgi:hypothetical protein
MFTFVQINRPVAQKTKNKQQTTKKEKKRSKNKSKSLASNQLRCRSTT